MRYRVGGPLIDGLMAELGMGGGSLNAMLAGSEAAAVPPAKPRPKLNGGNGSGDQVAAE
jgi:hypothetical protein